jgi:hypothetical protein
VSVFISILQIVLALHTGVGGIWMSSNSEHVMPSLAAIPHGVWMGLMGLQLLCAIGLIVPIFNKRAAILAPVSAALVAAEMLLFSAVHLASGATSIGPVLYWLGVAAVCGFIVYGRLVRKPVRRAGFA